MAGKSRPTTAERLGYPADAKLLILHAAAPGEELTAITSDAAARAEAFRPVTTSEPVRHAIAAEGIKLIGYRELREAQRAGA